MLSWEGWLGIPRDHLCQEWVEVTGKAGSGTIIIGKVLVVQLCDYPNRRYRERLASGHRCHPAKKTALCLVTQAGDEQIRALAGGNGHRRVYYGRELGQEVWQSVLQIAVLCVLGVSTTALTDRFGDAGHCAVRYHWGHLQGRPVRKCAFGGQATLCLESRRCLCQCPCHVPYPQCARTSG